MTRRFFGLACGLLMICAPALGQEGPPAPCRVESAQTAAVVAVTPRFEIALDDGRMARLLGLAPAPADFLVREGAERLRAQLAAQWVGRPVYVAAVGPRDRWGRVAALLSPLDGGPEASLAFLAAGAGRAWDAREAGAGGAGCPEARFSAEKSAREAGLGLWGEAYYAPQQAHDRAGLLARGGQFALVEGTVRRVGTGRLRAYLDFTPERDGFSVTATTRTQRLLADAGLSLAALKGRRVRCRGVIEIAATRAGAAPRMELIGPGAIEVIGSAAPGAAR